MNVVILTMYVIILMNLNRHFKKLDLEDNYIGAEGARSLAEALRVNQVR